MSVYARFAVVVTCWGLAQSVERGFVYCPAYPCTCESIGGALYVNCRGIYLSSLPKFLSFQGRIKELSLRHNSIQSLPAGGFRGVHIEELDLLDNAVTFIDKDAFVGLENYLLSLSLQLYAMYGLPTLPLARLNRLKILVVRGCWQQELRADLFLNLTQLRELHLVGCRIAIIRPGAFRMLPRLTSLVLSQNALQGNHLPELHLLEHLVNLDLSHNGIKHLSNTALVGFSKLQTLKICSNSLVTIGKFAFRSLGFSLEELDMRDNHINDQALSSLTDLNLLRRLDLSQNHISNLSGQYFLEMRLLTSLNAASNNIRFVDKLSFQGLESCIRELNLRDNPLELIQPGTFSELRALEKLNLSNTKLGGTFTSHTLDGLVFSLRSLDVSKSFIISDDLQTFSGLLNITNLDVSSNRITHINFHLMQLWSKLRYANFSHNNVTIISAMTIPAYVSALQTLDLSWNGIQTIPECIFFVFKDLRDVRLDGNPLVCNCSLAWLYRWLQFRYSSHHQLSRRWTCSNPTSLRDKLFSGLQPSEFTCSKNSTMGERCLDMNGAFWADKMNSSCGPICLNISRLQVDSVLLEWQPKYSRNYFRFNIILRRRNDSHEVASTLVDASNRNYNLISSILSELDVCVIALDKELLPLEQSCKGVPAYNVGKDDVTSQARLDNLIHNSFVPLLFIYVSSSLAVVFVVACVVVCVQRKQRTPRRVKPFYLAYPAWHDSPSSDCRSSFTNYSRFVGAHGPSNQFSDMLRLRPSDLDSTLSVDLPSMVSSRRQSRLCPSSHSCACSTISSLPRGFKAENLSEPVDTTNQFFFHF